MDFGGTIPTEGSADGKFLRLAHTGCVWEARVAAVESAGDDSL